MKKSQVRDLLPVRLRTVGRLSIALFLLTALGVLAACGQPDVQPLTFAGAPWQDGEVSLYRVIDDDDEFAGTLRFDINRADDGWTVRREIVARGDNEIVVVETAGENLKPSAADLTRMGAAGTESVKTTYAGSQVDMELTTVQDVTTYQRSQIPSDARDQRTMLMLLRMLPLEERYSVRFNSYLPVADLLDRVTLVVRTREEIDVPAGRFDTWKVELDTGDSSTTAWIGVDTPRPLVKYQDSRSGASYELMELMPTGE